MSNVSLPIITLNVRQQQYSCHSCGNCCRDFTVQLREDDVGRLQEQDWEEKLGQPVTVSFRGVTYLRQREDGSCIFLDERGLCSIHAEYGFEEKPIACQLFPFSLTPTTSGAAMGLNFACQSVLENKGAQLSSHLSELRRMADRLPEVRPAGRPPLLTKKLRASTGEVKAVSRAVDEWLRQHELSLSIRLDGLAWVVQSLAAAKLDDVRDDRFVDLLEVLFSALPDELDHHPIEPPAARQKRMLRQAVFARTEDPKIYRLLKRGRWRETWAQMQRNRRFKSGRGAAPVIGVDWPGDVELRQVELVTGASDEQAITETDDLITRYLRATVLGGRAWGAGYYRWPIVAGLQAVLLNVASVGWLARLYAAGFGRNSVAIEDVRAALGRVDRTSGRARWLGSNAERLRLRYLNVDDGLRRLIDRYRLTVT